MNGISVDLCHVVLLCGISFMTPSTCIAFLIPWCLLGVLVQYRGLFFQWFFFFDNEFSSSESELAIFLDIGRFFLERKRIGPPQ